MKRLIALLLVLMMLATAAWAESLIDEDYTDVPTAMTQDSVFELFAEHDCRVDAHDCMIETLLPDEISVALLDSVYHFVWEEKNRPARYYDEETQKKIAELAGCDIDILHMTEAMRLQLTGDVEEDAVVTATMRLDVEYYVGQLVIVVMGIPQENGEYIWYPYRGRVERLAEIKWDIPEADWNELNKQPVSFHVLTTRIGPRGEKLWHEEQYAEHYSIFSKDSGDVIKTRRWYTESGEPIEDTFSVWIEELTKPMQIEVERIAKHVEEEKPVLDYFPIERKDEALLMMPDDVIPEELIIYDIIALRDKDYKDTYGDVNVEIVFGTAYDPEKAMTILAGFPIPEAEEQPFFEWFVLRAEALIDSDAVEIGLKQLNLPRMEEEPMMLVVISEDLEPETEETEEIQE